MNMKPIHEATHQPRMTTARLGLSLWVALACGSAQAAPAPLRLEVFTGSDGAYRVTSTLIAGPTESLLVDAQFQRADAARLADRIEATHTRLRAIFVTHPDLDHYLGLALLHERFPEARLLMTPRALEVFRRTVEESLAYARRRFPGEAPSALPTPEVLPSNRLSVDGQEVLIVPDLQGDVAGAPANSLVIVPSLRAVVLGDLAFRGVHPWLEGSTPRTRDDWRAALSLVRALDPRLVVAGHGSVAPERDLASIEFTDRYLEDFEAARAASTSPEALVAALKARYAHLEQPRFLEIAARSVYAAPAPAPAAGDAPGAEEARRAIEEGSAAWGRARVALDQAAFDRALAPDFYAQLPGRRLTRQEFIDRITRYPYGRVTRFDSTILSVQRQDETWVAITLEKIEYDQVDAGGRTTRGYMLAVTRDGWKLKAGGWKVLFSELLGSQMWRDGTPPPIASW